MNCIWTCYSSLIHYLYYVMINELCGMSMYLHDAWTQFITRTFKITNYFNYNIYIYITIFYETQIWDFFPIYYVGSNSNIISQNEWKMNHWIENKIVCGFKTKGKKCAIEISLYLNNSRARSNTMKFHHSSNPPRPKYMISTNEVHI